MPKHVIKSDRNTQWVVNKDGHTWVLEKQATLEVNPGPAILIEDGFNRNSFFIDGDIFSGGLVPAEGIGIRNDGDRNMFTLGNKGEIEALQGMTGTGDHATVVNHGKIVASGVAIAQNEDFTLVNTNRITGSYGVSVAQAKLITNGEDGYIGGHLTGITLFGDGASKIVNKGEILGSINGAIVDGDGSVTIQNTGTINGDLHLGGGRDILNTTKGTVSGTVHGGDGADVYRVGQSLFIVEELDGGNDAVYSTADFTLSSNIEGLVLKGNKNIDGAGNASNNEIVGNKGNNMLYGAGGDDVLIGGRGNDTLSGGAVDDDDFLFAKGFGKDVITDFEAGVDQIVFIQINGLNDVGDVMPLLEQHGADVWIETNGGRLILENIDVGMLDANDFSVVHS
jgi:Ca2+-binding RTX toxin-like protein